MVEDGDFGSGDPGSGLDSRLLAALDRAGQALSAELRRRSRALGLTETQARVLLRLAADPAPLRRIGELAPRLDVTQPTVSDAVATLVRKGLIERHPDPGDRRASTLGLTGPGKRAASELEYWDRRVAGPAAGLDQAAQESAVELLFELLGGLNENGVIAEARMCTTCRFFEQPVTGRAHCRLLDITLEPEKLRLDCPDHEAA